jgi:voltage-gated potassium channel Kch
MVANMKNRFRFLVVNLSFIFGFGVTSQVSANTLNSSQNPSQVFVVNSNSYLFSVFFSEGGLSPKQFANAVKSEKMAPNSRPETWSIVILGLGLLLYQVRRRKSVAAVWDIR